MASMEIFLASRSGNAIRFNEADVRPMGRTASGVRGMRLADDKDEVVGLVTLDPTDKEFAIMVISEKGNGKRTDFEEYRLTGRGGKGVKTLSVTAKTGAVVALKAVKEEDDLMITTKNGITIRMNVTNIGVMGRATQGVRVIRLDNDDNIADVAIIQDPEDPDAPNEENWEEGEGGEAPAAEGETPDVEAEDTTDEAE